MRIVSITMSAFNGLPLVYCQHVLGSSLQLVYYRKMSRHDSLGLDYENAIDFTPLRDRIKVDG